MSEEQVDALVLAARFDEAGLRQSSRAILAEVQRASSAVNQAGGIGLPVIDVAQIRQASNASRDLGAEASKLGSAFEFGRQGGRRMETALTSMALASAGATGNVARLTEGLVIFGAASLPLLEVAAALSVLAVVYELLTKREQEATKAREALVKAFEQRLTAGLPETTTLSLQLSAVEEQRALLEKELGKEERQHIRDLTAEVTLYSTIRAGIELITGPSETRLKLAKATREVEEGILLLHRLEAQAAVAAALQLLSATDQVRKAVEATRTAAVDSQTKLAAQQPQTFGAQPGVISQQEVASFEARKRLAQEVAAADVASLQTRRNIVASDRDLAIAAGQLRGEQITAANAQVAALDLEIQARRITGALQVQAIRDEQAITAATRQRIQLEKDHADRVAAAGGGNILGKAPTLAPDIGFGRVESVLPRGFTKDLGLLPSDEDVAHLRHELQAIPPIGLPTAADFEAARRAALPPILQGAQQQGIQAANPFADTVQDLRKATAEAKRFADAVKAARTEGQRMADALSDIGVVASGLASVGRSLGFISEEAATAFENAGRLADALAQVAASASTGNIIGAVVAGAGFLGQAFGESPLEREHNDLLKQNNERLADLKLSLNQAFQGGAGVKVSQDVLATQTVLNVSPTTGFHLSPEFQRALDAAGLSLTEFAALVKQQTGIEILDREGHLVAAAFIQAREAVDKFVEQITHFGTSASAIESKITTEEALGIAPRSSDPQVAALQHDRDVQLQALHLSEAEEARIRALDLSTAQGRAEFLRFERGLFERANAGTLTPEELGAFQNVDELGASIGDAANDVNVFSASVKDATGRMGDFNLPPGFKRQLFAFQASDFGFPTLGSPTDGAQLPLPAPNMDPGRLPGPNDPGPVGRGALPATGAPQMVVHIGNLTINVDGSGSPEETAQTIVNKLRGLAMAQTGDSMNFTFT